MDFRQTAIITTTLSELMTGKEAVKTSDIIKKYPNGITITDFDIVNITNKKTRKSETVPVFTFAEDDKAFFFGGFVFMKIVSEWLKAYEGDLSGCRQDFRNSDGLKVILERTVTQNGNDCTTVTVL